MPISTYSTLVSAVRSHLAREDLDLQIPTFIDLAEWKIARLLRVSQLMTSGAVVFDAESSSAALPDRFLEVANVKVTSSGAELFYTPPDRIDQLSGAGVPWLYTLVGTSLVVAPTWTAGGSLTLTYWRKEPALSESTTSNWYTANAPDALLYGALVGAEPYLKNDSRVALWKEYFAESIASINEQYAALDPQRRMLMANTGRNAASDLRNAT